MPAVFSSMLPLGTLLPEITLPDTVSGNVFNSSTLQIEKGLVILFICNHCPYVHHIEEMLVQIAKQYIATGIEFWAINSNDIEKYPSDSPEYMRLRAVEKNYPFPYLFDEDQQIAKAFHAACTPDFFLFNRERSLVYRGRFDETRPAQNTMAHGGDLKAALDAVMAGSIIPEELQKPAIGCSIKWKIPGN
jgi:thiol-disulfide isomerase/thioredoxin